MLLTFRRRVPPGAATSLRCSVGRGESQALSHGRCFRVGPFERQPSACSIQQFYCYRIQRFINSPGNASYCRYFEACPSLCRAVKVTGLSDIVGGSLRRLLLPVKGLPDGLSTVRSFLTPNVFCEPTVGVSEYRGEHRATLFYNVVCVVCRAARRSKQLCSPAVSDPGKLSRAECAAAALTALQPDVNDNLSTCRCILKPAPGFTPRGDPPIQGAPGQRQGHCVRAH